MFASVDDLVQRQASILAEIDSLDAEQHNALANLPVPEDAVSTEIRKASRLLRGLLRTRNVGSSDHKTTTRGRIPSRVSSRRCRVFSSSTFCRCLMAALTASRS